MTLIMTSTLKFPRATLEAPATDNPAPANREELARWYGLMHLARLLDDKARNYLKLSLGWSYHAPAARRAQK